MALVLNFRSQIVFRSYRYDALHITVCVLLLVGLIQSLDEDERRIKNLLKRVNTAFDFRAGITVRIKSHFIHTVNFIICR